MIDPRPSIRAFIFDLDGVITDTAEYHYLAWKQLADAESLPFTREDNEALRGVSRRASLLLLLKGKPLPEQTLIAWMERKNAYYRDLLTRLTAKDLLPGAAAFLEEARAAGLLLGLGSASRNAVDVIQRLGIAAMFDAIGDGLSVSRSKPAPDLFVWVAGRLGVSPADCVVFEDAEAGIEAAQSAQMFTVGLGPAERVASAQLHFPDLAHVTVQEVLARLPEMAAI